MRKKAYFLHIGIFLCNKPQKVFQQHSAHASKIRAVMENSAERASCLLMEKNSYKIRLT